MTYKTLLKRISVCCLPLTILLGNVGSISIGGKTPLLIYSDIFLFVLLCVFILKLMMSDIIIIHDKPVFLLILLYFYAHILSLLFNGSGFANGLLSFKVFLNCFITYFVIISFCKDDNDIEWLLYGLSGFAAGLSLILMTIFVFSPSSIDLKGKELIDIGWGKSNYLASFLVMIIPVNIGLILTTNKFTIRMFFIACLVIEFAAVLITLSRGAMLSLVIVLVLMLPTFIKYSKISKFILVIVGFFGIVTAVIRIIIPEQILTLALNLIIGRLQNTDQSRINLMRLALEDFAANPLLGIGPFQSKVMISRYEVMPHNLVLQLLSELGLLGAIPFLVILMVFLYRAYINCVSSKNILDYFILASFLTAFTHSMVELTFQGAQYMTIFGILIAIINLKYLKYKNIILS